MKRPLSEEQALWVQAAKARAEVTLLDGRTAILIRYAVGGGKATVSLPSGARLRVPASDLRLSYPPNKESDPA